MNGKELKRTILGLYLMRISMGGMACAIPIIVLFWKKHGLTFSQITLLQSFFALLLMLLEVPSGYIADLWGRKRALLCGGLFFSCGSGVFLFADSLFHFACAEVLCAVALSLISGADAALLYDSLKAANREEQYEKTWGSILAVSLISYALFNSIGGIAYSWNSRLPFLLSTLINCGMIPAALMMKEPVQEKLICHKGYVKTLFAVIIPTIKENRQYCQLVLTYAFIFTGLQVALWFYQPFFQSCGVEPFWFGFIFTSFNIVAALGSRYAENFDRAHRSLPFGVVPLALIASSYLLMGTCTWHFGFTIIFIQQLVRGWLSASISRQINTIIGSKERATLLSFSTMIGSCLYSMTLPIMGYMADTLSMHSALIIGGLSLFGILVLGITSKYFNQSLCISKGVLYEKDNNNS